MRWFVTGSEGQLGTALRRRLGELGEPCWGRDLELDVADPEAVADELASLPGGPPEVLVNAAAFTQVDRCEQEPELAARINALAPAGLARLCSERGIRFVHISTDYVFDGEGEKPYREEDPPAPRSVYGHTKWQGERAAMAECSELLLVRTSWVFGRGRNFIAAILGQAERVAAGEGALRVVDDQRGRPTYAQDLAEAIRVLVAGGHRGLFHFANDGEASWWDLARAVLDRSGYGGLEIERIATLALDLPAPRPRYSVLDLGKARKAGVPMRPWQEALEAYLASEDGSAVPVP
ncbi:MAG: dTDP-4-dehydrorhamnose reductase [Deltaproteobacteria bacterium]|jgi:dTDP-4-dehydrorhamnose reductase|nr:dTDP-4-dehydrorhamnose reductase [Deltaproteobacteria bacterium]